MSGTLVHGLVQWSYPVGTVRGRGAGILLGPQAPPRDLDSPLTVPRAAGWAAWVGATRFSSTQ